MPPRGEQWYVLQNPTKRKPHAQIFSGYFHHSLLNNHTVLFWCKIFIRTIIDSVTSTCPIDLFFPEEKHFIKKLLYIKWNLQLHISIGKLALFRKCHRLVRIGLPYL